MKRAQGGQAYGCASRPIVSRKSELMNGDDGCRYRAYTQSLLALGKDFDDDDDDDMWIERNKALDASGLRGMRTVYLPYKRRPT